VIRVGVVGATGKMGREVCRAVHDDDGLELVAAVSRRHSGEPVSELLGLEGIEVVASDRLESVAEAKAQVLVDFTGPSYAPEHVAWGIEQGIHVVEGSTGFELDPTWAAQDRVGIVVASNFALGAVLMMGMAEKVARFLPSAEVIELHHDGKADAPGGTALATARRIAAARAEAPRVPGGDDLHPGARGADVDGVRVHSVRLPGLLAHHEVVFGGSGEVLTLRHDSTDRSSFMPGVLIAIHAVGSRPGLTVGLEPLLDLA
jgi:4-hydroxy-tetrahydrodipicolinate reductase